jgi:NAD(P)H-dependent flavin oxidoreductase YrpB (nitropropane dioxygenase family)
LKIGKKWTKFPVIQGGMGIGVSAGRLAGSVAACGGAGTISAVGIGYRQVDHFKAFLESNLRAMEEEFQKARSLSVDGVVGFNIMTVITDYVTYVKKAVSLKADFIVSGAGLPLELPKFVKGTDTQAVPIVSSAKAAKIILKIWKKKWEYIPQLIVIEGPEAGGHLGFKASYFEKEEKETLEDLLLSVREAIAPFEEQVKDKIQLVVAGGIVTPEDVKAALDMGADGVQMGTRFIATEECDADPRYKQKYVEAKEEDVIIIQSPVGLPGRALKNQFTVEGAKERARCRNCLTPCDPSKTIYCIADALERAVRGDVDGGLLFTGSQVGKIHSIKSVKEIFAEIEAVL